MTRRPYRYRAAWLYGAYERDCLDRGGRPVTDTMGRPTGCLLP